MKNQASTSKSIVRILAATAGLLLIALMTMQLTDEMDWGSEDFIFAGLFFIAAGVVYEFGIKRINNSTKKLIIGLIVLVVFALIWAEAAVGIFD